MFEISELKAKKLPELQELAKQLNVPKYRSFKKLLGETSLERKCRLMFAGALMLLVGVSFWVYARLNQSIVQKQYRDRAEVLIAHNLLFSHFKSRSLLAIGWR